MSNQPPALSPAEWFATPPGRYLLAREQEYFDSVVADVFGYNAFQVGLPELDFLRASRIALRCRVDVQGAADLRAAAHDLPIESNSADLFLLPHVLEFSAHPHQILREIERALRPEGQMVIACFNPWSLWGIRRTYHFGGNYPWRGRFINLPRLKDWLALLNFEVLGGQFDCYVPPCGQQKWLDRFGFMEKAGDRWWPIAGGVYFLQAVKRVRSMRLIMPKWSDRLAPKKALAPSPKKVRDKGEAVAARQSAEPQ